MLRRTLSCIAFALCALAPSADLRAQVPLSPPTLTPRAIAARAASATVGVRALGEGGKVLGNATGFFVGAGGLLATNYHAIDGADSLAIVLSNGAMVSGAALVAADPHRDLALLRVGAPAGYALPLGSDEDAVIGDRVYVMGNPLGMDGTFSDGLVSAKRRVGNRAMLQITAPISPGSSGGPVMNEAGEVIGVVALSFTRGQNLNLAVAARDLRALISAGGFARSFPPDSPAPLPSPGPDTPVMVNDPVGRDGGG